MPSDPYDLSGGMQSYVPRGVQEDGDIASQLPYQVLVDAMRNGSTQFGQPRSLNKQEKLDATLGGLQTFFGRIAQIGTPSHMQAPLNDLIQSGQEQTQRAQSGPMREAIGGAMQQAAAARAQMEQEHQAKAQADEELKRKQALAGIFEHIAPDIEGAPPEMVSSFAASGDPSQLIHGGYYKPGAAERQKELGRETRQEARETARDKRATAAEDARWERLKLTEKGKDGRKPPGKDSGGGKLSRTEVEQDFKDIELKYKDRPDMQAEAYKIWREANKDIQVDDDTAALITARGRMYSMQPTQAQTGF